MRRKIFCLIIVSVVMVITLVGFIPQTTHFDVTLEAAKLEGNRSVVENVTMHIWGNYNDYLFLTDRVEVSIAPFDDLRSFKLSTVNGVEGGIKSVGDQPYIVVACHGWSASTEEMIFADLAFSKDYDRWLFSNLSTNEHYVASASGKYSTDELIDFFSSLLK